MTVVYIDSLFLLNLIVDYLLLLGAARLSGAVLCRPRLALGAVLGAAYACAVFLPGLERGVLSPSTTNTPRPVAGSVRVLPVSSRAVTLTCRPSRVSTASTSSRLPWPALRRKTREAAA